MFDAYLLTSDRNSFQREDTSTKSEKWKLNQSKTLSDFKKKILDQKVSSAKRRITLAKDMKVQSSKVKSPLTG